MVLFYIPKLVLLQFWVNVYIISIKWICCYCCLWSKAKDPVITWVVLVVALLFFFYFHLCIIKLQPPCYPTTKLFLSFPLSLTLSLLPVSLSLSLLLCLPTYANLPIYLGLPTFCLPPNLCTPTSTNPFISRDIRHRPRSRKRSFLTSTESKKCPDFKAIQPFTIRWRSFPTIPPCSWCSPWWTGLPTSTRPSTTTFLSRASCLSAMRSTICGKWFRPTNSVSKFFSNR